MTRTQPYKETIKWVREKKKTRGSHATNECDCPESQQRAQSTRSVRWSALGAPEIHTAKAHAMINTLTFSFLFIQILKMSSAQAIV